MPRFSVFTPTHDTQWLADCYRSLAGQSDGDWEWVVLRNGERPGPVPAEALADPRVRVLDTDDVGFVYLHGRPGASVGALKRAAVAACAGEILVELDHDDMLAAGCLRNLAEVAAAAPGGFYYSDWAGVRPDGEAEVFDNGFGWEKYTAEVLGERRTCLRAFDATARALCEIHYAPNHVRAWHRTAYERAGGHDPAMPVGDDHDLVCRTFLAGVPFVHVRGPLYLYRASPDSTSHVRAGEIRRAQAATRDRYLHQLVAEWCGRARLPMLDLGGAHNPAPGHIPVDVSLPETDPALYCHTMIVGTGRWPGAIGGDVMTVLRGLPPDSVGCVRAVDFIEHLPRDQMVPFMNEVHRVLAPQGWLLSSTPSTDGRGAFQDPTHTNFVNENSFWYYTNGGYSKYLNGAVTGRFQAVRLWTDYPSRFHEQNNIPYVHADLCAVKAGRHPGPVYI